MNRLLKYLSKFALSTLVVSSLVSSTSTSKAEPTSALAAGAAVVGIIGGVVGVISDAKKEALLREINGKLNIVIRSQVEILRDLGDIKILITETAYNSFRDNTIVRLNSNQDFFEVLITDNLNASNRSQYIDLLSRISETTSQAGQYDVAAYVAYSAGVGTTLALHQVLGTKKQTVDAQKAIFAKYYENWLDPNNPRGITAAIAATNSRIAANYDTINSIPKIDYYDTPRNRCIYRTTVNITGSIETGFGATFEEKTLSCLRDQDFCSRMRHHCVESLETEYLSVIDQIDTLSNNENLSSFQFASPAAFPIPEYAPTRSGHLNNLNQVRIAIFQNRNILILQEILKRQIEQARDLLKK